MAWEFLTGVLHLPPEKLWATIHEGDSSLQIGADEEARRYWQRYLPPERILPFPSKDNFWQMGDTGPCGPCSEIVIDQGPGVGCRRADCRIGCSCDRFLELWNLVFMQFERHADGRMRPLPKPSIDTGMGLERITAIVQGVKSNFDTDLFIPLFRSLGKWSHQEYISGDPEGVSFRVIADHIRAASFLISDGVLPSNEGRGYVLRRIMRRAMRHSRKLGVNEPILFRLTDDVVELMHDAYPELVGSHKMIKMVISSEEERFSETLNVGLRLWAEERQKLLSQGMHRIPGDLLFKLYDTYGFPLDLTEEIARDEGFSIDRKGFETAMELQRTRARDSWKGSGEEALREVYKTLSAENLKTEFVGYERLKAPGNIVKIFNGDREVEEAAKGDEVEVVTDQSPFYGESGGQEGDQGVLLHNGDRMEVLRTSKPIPNIIVHRGVIQEGRFHVGDRVSLEVDGVRREKTALNHTATHLLQAALREVLGEHVKQAGSLVAPGRLRFDFTHFSPLTEKQIEQVEGIVNAWIRRNVIVDISFLSYKEALDQGAMALFGEKYGDIVRLVRVGDGSAELCGGTHVGRSGDIGFFRILSEGGVAAGVRRIEAVTGEEAWKTVKRDENELRSLSALLKSKPGELAEKTQRLIHLQKDLERKLDALQAKMTSGQSKDLASAIRTLHGIQVLSQQVEAKDPRRLREMADQIKAQIHSGIILLGAQADGKAMLLCSITPDLTEKYSAQKIIKELAQFVGGTGGGRVDMAQAGGVKVEGLRQALEKIFDLI
jgi:alanyl-tRNA synthetase